MILGEDKNMAVWNRALALLWASFYAHVYALGIRSDCLIHYRYRYYETKTHYDRMIVGIELREGRDKVIKTFYRDTRYDEDGNYSGIDRRVNLHDRRAS